MSEKNDLDDAAAPESSEVFEFGESTILQLRNQPFRVDDQYGTMTSVPLPDLEAEVSPFAPDAEAATPVASAAASPAASRADDDDAVARVERKLDLALRQIEQLQQRLDSIDSALTRVLNR